MRKVHIAFHPTEGVQSNGSFHIQKLPSASLLSPFKRGDSSTQPLSSLSASHTRSSLSTHSKSFENANRVGVGVAVAIAVGFGVALAVGVGVAVTFEVVRVVVAVAVGVGVAPLLFTKRFLEPKLCAKNGFRHVTVTVLQCKRKHKKRQEDACICIGDALALCYRTNFFHSFASESSKMVLEATMICIDNSEWMRNGDYSPSRFQAQADAVNLICGAKTQSNPENTVGVLTMAGKGVRVLVTPTSDLGKILACMHGLDIGGEMNLAAGIQVAQLALKHRQNKKQQQRIIVFAGSPVKHEKKMLEMIGRKLKKNSVALDIVSFGEEDEGKTEKLEALLAAVNNNDTSHIVHVPSGPNALSDVLISTPIFTGDGEGGSGFAAAAATAAAGGVSGFEFGVDPNLDPELALALRVSMEEERARQEAAAKKAAEDAANQEKGGEQQASSQHATMTERAGAATSEAENKTSDLMDDENALLQQALAMSMDDSAISHDVKDTDMSEASASDPDLALALQLSITDSAKDQSSQSDMSKLLADQSFVSSILASLPGVDPNDPSVKDLLASMQNQSEPQQKNDDKPSNEEEKK